MNYCFKFLLVGVISVCFSACIKEKFTADELTAIDDVLFAQSISASIQPLADQAHSLDSSILSSSGKGIKISLDTSHTASVLDLLTIDFGSVAVQCRDNKYRTGKIKITYSKGFKSGFSDLGISFIDFKTGNSLSVLHSISNNSKQQITCKGFNTKGYNEWSIHSEITISKNNSGTIIYTDDTKREQTSGDALGLDWDNKFTYAITSSITTSNKIELTTDISNSKNLAQAYDCTKPFNNGIEIAHSSSFKNDIAIDFGDGSCTDNKATLQKARTKQMVEL